MRTAAAIASAPLFRNWTLSAQGMIPHNRSATSTSRASARPQTLPLAIASATARETFGSALDASLQLLVKLGYAETRARRVVERFREYDERQIAQNAPHRKDIEKLIALTEQGRRDIAQLLAAEAALAPQADEHIT